MVLSPVPIPFAKFSRYPPPYRPDQPGHSAGSAPFRGLFLQSFALSRICPAAFTVVGNFAATFPQDLSGRGDKKKPGVAGRFIRESEGVEKPAISTCAVHRPQHMVHMLKFPVNVAERIGNPL